jgi:gamma-glutamyltranspeptidase/glutathione hydrolase
MWKRAEPLLAPDPGSARTFLSGGRAPVRGETFRNPALAQTLRRIAEGGADAFYRGEVARRLSSFAEELGSPLTVDDLAAHTSSWVEPISFTFRGCEVWELPPNTQGLVVLEMLNILEGCDLRGLGHNTPGYLHALIEAKKLAYENRAFLYADPDFAPMSVGDLLGPEHGARQRRRIDPERASWSYAPTAIGGVSDTVYITVVDEQRNAVSLIQSIFREFGSGNTPPGLGFAIQNRGSLFSLDPNHPNHLEPGKRPFHTIIPAMVTKNGAPVFSFGVMGGDMQPQGQTQILVNMLEFGMDPQQAGEALRIRHDRSSTPQGDVMRDGGEVSLEPGFSTDVLEGLERKGHRVRVRDGGYGGYQGIWIDADTARLLGGSEPRKDGCAKGY